jgi:hypothetical protein
MSLPPIIPANPFPKIPKLPGVPQIPRQVVDVDVQAIQIIAAARLIQQLFQAATAKKLVWALLDSNFDTVIAPDNYIAFDNRAEWRLLDYPVQDGAFASYNKVIVPYTLSVRMTKAGSVADRENFLSTLDAAASSFNLYTLVTPERSYTNLNIERYEVTRRGASGAYFLTEVDVFFRQIRQINGVYSSSIVNTANAKPPSALPNVNNGTVLPQTVPAQAASKVNAALHGVPQ